MSDDTTTPLAGSLVEDDEMDLHYRTITGTYVDGLNPVAFVTHGSGPAGVRVLPVMTAKCVGCRALVDLCDRSTFEVYRIAGDAANGYEPMHHACA